MNSQTLLCLPALALLLGACGTISKDETDHDALFVGARVRKPLDDGATHDGLHLEASWRADDGETDELDYTIQTVSFGVGMDREVGEQGWIGGVGGLAWRTAQLDVTPDEYESMSDFGSYAALQGGWRATSWLEPYARAQGALFLRELGHELSIEAGARIHAIEHASLFVGWRYADLRFADFDDAALGFDTLDLYTSGLVVVLEFWF
ncbi:MAG: hypothetical protein L6Q99_14575 [Planctomycetes bacterium]|nr:hypothetical protein [Planctomycetota bacterium]